MAEAPREFLGGKVMLHPGDCLEVLARLPADSVDAVVTDPPYHLASIVKRFGGKGAKAAKSGGATGVYARSARGFMGKSWDGGDVAFRPETWAAVLRVLKPGGNLLAFAAPKNVHWMAGAIEMAGFEMRDRLIEFVAADAAVARFMATLAEEQVEAFLRCLDDSGFGGELAWGFGSGFPKSLNVSAAIDKVRGAAREVVSRRRISRSDAGSWAGNINGGMFRAGEREQVITGPASDEAREWSGWGTALKPAYEPIVWARKPLAEASVAANVLRHGTGAVNIDGCLVGAEGGSRTVPGSNRNTTVHAYGDGLGVQGGRIEATGAGRWPANLLHDGSADVVDAFPWDGEASAARFFYSAKADGDDRLGSRHPTVKPLDLMQWLVRFACRTGGVVLDPFAGTGTTGEAAFREGCRAILIEREAEYQADIARRMDLATAGPETRRMQAQAARAPAPADLGGLFGDAAEPSGGGRRVYGRFVRDGRSGRSG